ncbi:MAG: Nucleoside-diphosphate-sugar epimerase [Paucimonas sp.]|nr:Nucleoside-diphosphate-sugar epimerase [Paucimonas sp.]
MASGPSLDQALAGARFTPPVAESRSRTVLLAGAAGRLGERMLARLLGCPTYCRIQVLADAPMPSTERKLGVVVASACDFTVDDLVLVVSGDAAAPSRQPGAPGRGLRTQVYSACPMEAVLPMARQARAAGVSRLMLVTPVHVLGQPAALYAQIATLAEAELHQMGFESLVLVRPTDLALRARRSGWGARLFGLVLDTATGLLTGLRHTPLSIDDIARGAVLALQAAPSGLTIIESAQLQEILRPNAPVAKPGLKAEASFK